MAISVDDILSRMITDAKNMKHDINISQGTETYIRFATEASALWGAYKQIDWTVDQFFPSSMSKESLEKFARERNKDPEGLTGAELLSFVLSYIRKPPSGGKPTDYERWALETVSAYSVVELDPSMISGTMNVNATAFCAPKDKESIAFSVGSSGLGNYVVVDFDDDKDIAGIGLGFTTVRGAVFKVYSSADGETWTLRSSLGAVGWSMDTFNNKVTARYWKIVLNSIDPLESWMTESLHDVKCFGVEFYAADESQEKATFAKVFKNAYGPGTLAILLAPVSLSMKHLEAVREHCEDEGPTAPKEIFVSVQRETPVHVRVNATVSGSFDNSTFTSEVQKYFAGFDAGDIIVTAQIEVFAIKSGATNASVQTSFNGVDYTESAYIKADPDQKFILGTLSVV